MICVCKKVLLHVYLIGDLNVDLLKPTHALSAILDVYCLKNVIQGPTCFKSVLTPTLLDVILTNKPQRLADALNVPTGISDFHNLVCAATKLHKPHEVARQITYRWFKKFDEVLYTKDLESAPLHVSGIFDDVDDQLWFHNALLTNVIDSHAPLKSRVIKRQQVPYMNGQLLKAINVKGMLLRKYYKCKTRSAWESYRLQRNKVTRLKRQAMKVYFDTQCNNTVKNSKQFWDVIRRFFTENCKRGSQNILLSEDKNIISHPKDVCNIFNNHFVNVAKDLKESDSLASMSVEQVISYYENHLSVRVIKDMCPQGNDFVFKPVTHDKLRLYLKSLIRVKPVGFI